MSRTPHEEAVEQLARDLANLNRLDSAMASTQADEEEK